MGFICQTKFPGCSTSTAGITIQSLVLMLTRVNFFDGVKRMSFHILYVEIVTDLFRDMKMRM